MELVGDTLSEHEAEGFINALDQRIRNIDDANLGNLDEQIRTQGRQLAQDLQKVAIINKRNALLAIKADQSLDKYVRSSSSPTRGFLSYLEGTNRSGDSAGRGVYQIAQAYKDKYVGELKARLTKAGVLDQYRKDMLVKEVYQEFYQPGSSGSEDARKIRDIMTALKQHAVKTQNLYGSFINFLPEHVVRQTYNTMLIKKNFGPERFKSFWNFSRTLTPEEYLDTFQNWKNFITPLLDTERTFRDAEPEAFLRGTFDNVMSGRHGIIQQADGAEINTNFFKAGALATKASQQRLLHFKDGESAFAAHKALSAEPLSKGFIVELEHAGTNIGLMQQLGPNPRGTIDNRIKMLEHEYSRSGDEEKLNNLQKGEHRITSALSFLDRSANIPENPTLQTATASAISLLSQAKLGKLFFFALPDRALMQSMLTRNGMRGMDALASVLKLSKPSNPDERLRLMMLGGEIKSFINSVNTRFSTGSEAGVPSAILGAQRNFFNLTGINWIDDVGTDAIVGALPRHLGAMADRDYDHILPEMQQMFKQYGITSPEWDAWRSTVYNVDKNGNIGEGQHRTNDNWITPDRFDSIPNDVIDSLIRGRDLTVNDSNRARQRDLLENKFRTWLTAQKDEGVLMPGSREHRLSTFGTQSGTWPGSIARLIMMFKTFPITVYTKIMEREMFGSGARTFLDWMKNEKNTNFHTTQLIAMSVIAGYVSLTLDELLQGKSARRFTDDQGNIDPVSSLQTARDSFLRSNGISLFGDLILRNFDSGQNNIISQLGGPAVNELVKGAALASQGIRGQATSKQAISFLRDNLPWVNLFYVKPILDHLIWYNIQEMLDPGSLRAYEIKHKQQYNQDYWLSPSEINQELHK